jgi:hypothetical protein
MRCPLVFMHHELREPPFGLHPRHPLFCRSPVASVTLFRFFTQAPAGRVFSCAVIFLLSYKEVPHASPR